MRTLLLISILLACAATADARLFGRRQACPAPTYTVTPVQSADCLRGGRCPVPPKQPAPPTNPPKFDFPDDPKPEAPAEPDVVAPDVEETSMDLNLILALASTILGGVGAYVASRQDDDPDNDMDALALAKDIVNRIAKARS